MITEFKSAALPKDLNRLRSFDRKVFPADDLFSSAEWRQYKSFWMIVDGHTVGCCAFQCHVDFQEDVREDDLNLPLKGSLYISTTGILPKYQGGGFGQLFKCWQIAYARYHEFRRIVANVRSRNTRMIALNKKFGFRILRTTPGYYSGPRDATVVMELKLGAQSRQKIAQNTRGR